MGKWGKPGADFHLCPVFPSNTLYGNSHFLSDRVSYSDGRNGEWLVLFLFNFVLLFDGRRDDILAPSAPIQLNRILDFVFPSKLKKKKTRHVLGINVFAASPHPTPVLGKSLPLKQEAAHS